MGLAYRQLGLEERRRIFRMVDGRRPAVEIAATLGRHRSTVDREIRRNRVQLDRALRRYRYHEHAYFEGYTLGSLRRIVSTTLGAIDGVTARVGRNAVTH